MTEAKPNTMFPGRPNYQGPVKGLFGLLHHDQLIETSDDVSERVAYIKLQKPKNEIPIRLHNMIYLGHCRAAIKQNALYTDYKTKQAPLYADYMAKLVSLDADYGATIAAVYADSEPKWAPLYADYKTKQAPLYADYKTKQAPLYADYEAKMAPLDAHILAYIKKYIPDCAWDGTKLRF